MKRFLVIFTFGFITGIFASYGSYYVWTKKIMPILGISETRAGIPATISSPPATAPLTSSGGTNTALDTSIPDELPTIPTSRITGRSQNGSSVTLHFKSLETPDNIIKHCLSELETKGWKAKLVSSNQGSDLSYQTAKIVGLKPDNQCEISISGLGQQSSITIEYQMRSQ